MVNNYVREKKSYGEEHKHIMVPPMLWNTITYNVFLPGKTTLQEGTCKNYIALTAPHPYTYYTDTHKIWHGMKENHFFFRFHSNVDLLN